MQAKVIPIQSSLRYVIEREIGQGGMGVVYEARDLERNTRVALKQLHETDALHIYRLKNEFRQLADVSHPNLVTLHELCFDGDKWFFTMELVDGETLDQYVGGDPVASIPPQLPNRAALATLASRGRVVRHPSVTLNQRAIGSAFPLPRITCNVPRLRLVLRQLVEAIGALHDAGKLHRDIKPSNVLVTSEGRVVVLDFGLVASSTHVEADNGDDDQRSVGGHVFGTPAYMSPEQAAGEPVTMASDWYSVGAVLYEAVTGQLPFDGTVLQILQQKDEHEPVPPGDLVVGVPDDLDQLCRALLRRNPAQRPTRAEILRTCSGGTNLPPPLDSTKPPITRVGELLVGREPHLRQLRQAFERTKSGQAVTVFVHGHSGMGKSALVRYFANELIKHDEAVVLRGRCYERESVPYKAFDDIIDALSRYLMRRPAQECAALLPRNIHALARLFPVLKRVNAVANARVSRHQTEDPRELRDQAFDALKNLLLRLSDFRPLVINIDDLQWGDVDSARLLTHLLDGPSTPPILFVGSYRRDEVVSSAFLRHVLEEHPSGHAGTPIESIEVDALSAEEAGHLTHELLRELPQASTLFAQTIAAESGGVPFFIGELTQHLKARGEATPAALASVALDNVISTRVASMSSDAQRVLEVLSVAARPIEQGVVLEAAGLPAGDRAALMSLRAARLIRTRGTRQSDSAETYHDRVREAVVAQLSDAQRRELHARIAQASERWGVGEPEHLVVHYAEAGEGGRAGETAIQAARAAAEQLAFNRAADLYRKAIELVDSSDRERHGLLHQSLGDALANAGLSAQAAEAYLQAAVDMNAPCARMMQRCAAQQFLRSGRIDQGVALTKSLFAGAKLEYPETEARALGSIVWHKTRLSIRGLDFQLRQAHEIAPATLERIDTLGAVFRELGVFDPLRGTAFQVQYLREALRAGEPHRVQQGLAWEAFNVALLGGPRVEQRVRAILERAETLASTVGTPYATATWQMARAGCCFFFGRYEEVLAPAEEARRSFREHCSGCSWEQNLLTSFRLGALEETGDLSEIAQEAPAQARQARERDDEFAKGFLALSVPLAHLMADDPARAMRLLEEQAQRLGPDFTTLNLWVMNRVADTLIYQGRGAEAHAHYERTWPAFTKSYLYRSKMFFVLGNWFRTRCAIAAATTPDHPALAIADSCAAALQRSRRSDGECWSLIARAGIAAKRGRTQLARSLLDDAISRCESHQMKLFGLYARYHREHRERPGHSQPCENILARLRAQGVVAPERWIATYAPGFTST